MKTTSAVSTKRLLDKAGGVMNEFQTRVAPWLEACFGKEISADKTERNHRFLEEALELVQANGCTRSEAHQLVDYVFSRPVGELHQEAGGVMVTLAALCLASDVDMHQAGEDELSRIWTKIDQIRARQAAKPKHSPLPLEWKPITRSMTQSAIIEAEKHLNGQNFDRGLIQEFLTAMIDRPAFLDAIERAAKVSLPTTIPGPEDQDGWMAIWAIAVEAFHVLVCSSQRSQGLPVSGCHSGV
jgi:hypothetical protein